jgi:hypothetical protein
VLIVSISGKIQFNSLEHDDPESGFQWCPLIDSDGSRPVSIAYRRLGQRMSIFLHLDKFEQLLALIDGARQGVGTVSLTHGYGHASISGSIVSRL